MPAALNGRRTVRRPLADRPLFLGVTLPDKSICRFKCVSWHWYGLITNPENRKKIPHTLSGFFYPSNNRWTPEDPARIIPDFVGIVGDEEPFSDPSLTFLASYRPIVPKICCNGLLFCLCWKVSPRDESDFVVCNPATEKWVVVPDSVDESIALKYHFVFDPAISPHFQVFEITDADENYGYIGDVNIYSSETGAWSCRGNGWGDELQFVSRGETVTPEQEELEPEIVGDSTPVETQGDAPSEAVFGYFYPADGGAGEE
ncbi:F-box protein At5g07610-like [Panicum virgatum]|uniref:F-box protein At5g07610-like n=1 Tax=Panicum virgatum TaxID=38727 RepID=UPI0019D625E2|nr:F-box protein At5g07610-like [Panicum virgatum]